MLSIASRDFVNTNLLISLVLLVVTLCRFTEEETKVQGVLMAKVIEESEMSLFWDLLGLKSVLSSRSVRTQIAFEIMCSTLSLTFVKATGMG